MKNTQLYISFTNFTADKKMKKDGKLFRSTKGEGHGFGLVRIDSRRADGGTGPHCRSVRQIPCALASTGAVLHPMTGKQAQTVAKKPLWHRNADGLEITIS